MEEKGRLFKNIINRKSKEDTEPISSVEYKGTAKMESMRKAFDNSIIVSEEEQEKNRREYEQSKSQSIHKEERENDEFVH